MRLAIENYPTPQGKTCDVVDLDRDGGGGRPLIVARFFEPEYAAAFLALPALLAACRQVAEGMPRYIELYADHGYRLAGFAEACGAAVKAVGGE